MSRYTVHKPWCHVSHDGPCQVEDQRGYVPPPVPAAVVSPEMPETRLSEIRGKVVTEFVGVTKQDARELLAEVDRLRSLSVPETRGARSETALREAYMAGAKAACPRFITKPYACVDCERGADEYVAELRSSSGSTGT